MDTGKVYFDSEGNECSIWQMVKREPTWAAVRIQEGEKAIDEITTLRQQLVKSESRVAELEDALVWALGKLSIEVPVTGGNVTYIRAFEKADKALSSNGRTYLLRKQAEAVVDAHNAMSDSFVLEATGVIQERAILRCQDFLNDYAQRLRQQADEAERAGGDHG
jgi:hypothetical protein